MTDLGEVRSLYNQGRLIPFVGAGVSAAVNWTVSGKVVRGPDWQEMVDQAMTDIGFMNPELLRMRGTDMQILEYYSLINGGMTRLTNWLLRQMSPPDEAIVSSCIHQQLIRMDKCPTIYTTNFDDYIERAFSLSGKTAHKVVLERDIRTDRGSTEIIKFHGDWDHPEKMILIETDFQKRMGFSDPMDLRLWSDLLNRSMLFIGYSFRDPNISQLFWKAKDLYKELPESRHGMRGYIVLYKPSEFERKLFEARNIEVIPIENKDKANGVAQILERIRS